MNIDLSNVDPRTNPNSPEFDPEYFKSYYAAYQEQAPELMNLVKGRLFDILSGIAAYPEDGPLDDPERREEYERKLAEIRQEIQDAIKEIEAAQKQAESNLPAVMDMPSSAMTNFVATVINAGPKGPPQSRRNRHEKISIAYDKESNKTQYIRRNKGTALAITILDAENVLKGSGKMLGKMFVFSLAKWKASGYSREIIFPLQDLVDLKMYKSIDAARRACKDFVLRMQSINLAKQTAGKKGEQPKFTGGAWLYNLEIQNNIARISVNDKIPLQLLAEFYTIMPLFAFSLSDNAFSIVRYIMFLARQNGDTLERNGGTFKIKIDSIRNHLALPLPQDVKGRKYKEKIRDPIENAIEEIEIAISENRDILGPYAFTITPDTDEQNIELWLDGNLEIGLQKDFADKFTAISDKKEHHKEERRRERIKAQEKALATKRETKDATQL